VLAVHTSARQQRWKRVSAGVKYFPGRRCVENGADHIIGVMCGAMKLIRTMVCIFCLRISIHHFSEHKILDLICSVTVLDVPLTLIERMKCVAGNRWHFTTVATFHNYLRFCKLWNWLTMFRNTRHRKPVVSVRVNFLKLLQKYFVIWQPKCFTQHYLAEQYI
jgi:hypothetical protein